MSPSGPGSGGRGSGGPSADVPDAGAAGLPDLVLVDGGLVPPARAVVSAFDRGLMFGESLFETVKVVDAAPCLWELHRRRLAAGCRELGIPLDVGPLGDGVRSLLAARPVGRGALRIQVTGGEQPGGGRGVAAPSTGRRPRVIARVDEVAPLPEASYAGGVDVVTAADLCRPLPGLKSGSYLASVAAKARAEAAGAYECLFLGDGGRTVVEGSFSNVLAWDGYVLVSPPASGRLPGVTLGVVVEEARRMGILTGERRVMLDALEEGALLLTGSLLGVCPCARVDRRALRGAPDLVARLRGALQARERASREEWVSRR